MAPGPDAQPSPTTGSVVTCSECGQQTTVPFTPTPGRPVYCRDCFAKRSPARPSGPRSGGFGGPSRFGAGGGQRFSRDAAPVSGRAAANQRKRMLAQGRKGHFMYDAKEILRASGRMDDQHHRAFLEGLFARGSRGSTEDAQVFLDEKVADETITKEERDGLGRLLERYSFWR